MDKRNVQWPKGRRAAISLTYDDGLANHLQVVGPQLESRGLRATFYVPLKEGILTTSLDWRKLAARGHELGNHTVFHPCWSPDGKWICFAAKERERRALCKVPASGGALQRIETSGVPSPTEPDWSPDGQYLAVADKSAPEAEADKQAPKDVGAGRGATDGLIDPI